MASLSELEKQRRAYNIIRGDTLWCAHCNTIKRTELFVSDATKLGGKSTICLECHNEKSRIYSKNNLEKRAASVEKWRVNNPEKWEKCRQLVESRRDKQARARRRREMRAANPEHNRMIMRKSFHKNRHKRTEYNKEKMLKQYNWLKTTDWEFLLSLFGKRCAYCGKALTFDNYHDPSYATQDHFISHFDGGEYSIENIVPACNRCNSSKNKYSMILWLAKGGLDGCCAVY